MQQTPQIPNNILSKSTGIECQECNGLFFDSPVLLRKISKFYLAELNPMNPPMQDQVIPVQCFVCRDCGSPLKEFFPEGMTDVEERLGLKKIMSPKFEL